MVLPKIRVTRYEIFVIAMGFCIVIHDFIRCAWLPSGRKHSLRISSVIKTEASIASGKLPRRTSRRKDPKDHVQGL